MSNPPAGWYPDPEGDGRRYWDGTAWTGQYAQGVDDEPDRRGSGSVGLVVGLGIASYVVLLAVLNPRIDGTAAFGAGRLIVPAVIGTVAVWAITRAVKRRLGWWVYALAVPVAVGAMGLLLTAGDLKDDADDRQSRGEETAPLVLPAAGGGWTVVDTAETRAEVRRVVQGMQGDPGLQLDSVLGAFYAHESAPDTLVFFIAANGEIDQDDSAEEAARNALAGASVDQPQMSDAGEVGGALGCGNAKAQGLEWVSCAWVGNGRAVMVRWSDASVDLGRAADLTRELRDRALG